MATNLKELLGDLLTPEMETKLSSHGVYIWDKNNKGLEPIPKYRTEEMNAPLEANINALKEQLKGAETTLAQRDSDLKTLKKAAEGNTELTAKIEEQIKINKEQREAFDTQKKDFDEKLKVEQLTLKKSYAVKESLMNAGVEDPLSRDILSKNFDISKLEIGEDGKIKDFDNLIKPFKENKSFESMFGKTVIAGQEHAQGTIQQQTTLQTQLAEAQKAGNLIQTIAIKRQIAEAGKQTPS